MAPSIITQRKLLDDEFDNLLAQMASARGDAGRELLTELRLLSTDKGERSTRRTGAMTVEAGFVAASVPMSGSEDPPTATRPPLRAQKRADVEQSSSERKRSARSHAKDRTTATASCLGARTLVAQSFNRNDAASPRRHSQSHEWGKSTLSCSSSPSASSSSDESKKRQSPVTDSPRALSTNIQRHENVIFARERSATPSTPREGCSSNEDSDDISTAGASDVGVVVASDNMQHKPESLLVSRRADLCGDDFDGVSGEDIGDEDSWDEESEEDRMNDEDALKSRAKGSVFQKRRRSESLGISRIRHGGETAKTVSARGKESTQKSRDVRHATQAPQNGETGDAFYKHRVSPHSKRNSEREGPRDRSALASSGSTLGPETVNPGGNCGAANNADLRLQGIGRVRMGKGEGRARKQPEGPEKGSMAGSAGRRTPPVSCENRGRKKQKKKQRESSDAAGKKAGGQNDAADGGRETQNPRVPASSWFVNRPLEWNAAGVTNEDSARGGWLREAREHAVVSSGPAHMKRHGAEGSEMSRGSRGSGPGDVADAVGNRSGASLGGERVGSVTMRVEESIKSVKLFDFSRLKGPSLNRDKEVAERSRGEAWQDAEGVGSGDARKAASGDVHIVSGGKIDHGMRDDRAGERRVDAGGVQQQNCHKDGTGSVCAQPMPCKMSTGTEKGTASREAVEGWMTTQGDDDGEEWCTVQGGLTHLDDRMVVGEWESGGTATNLSGVLCDATEMEEPRAFGALSSMSMSSRVRGPMGGEMGAEGCQRAVDTSRLWSDHLSALFPGLDDD